MANEKKLSKTKKVQTWVAAIIIIALVIYGVRTIRNQREALKNSSLVTGYIIAKSPSRGATAYSVAYSFKGRAISNEFTISADTLNIGDSIILRVSNLHPGDYYEYIKRAK